jgi:hypothetical protein
MRSGHEEIRKWMKKKPNILFSDYCRGNGVHGVMVSLHKSYSDFDEFMIEHDVKFGHLIHEVENILVNLREQKSLKPYNLKYLSEDI